LDKLLHQPRQRRRHGCGGRCLRPRQVFLIN
jgi:hypothetical protein